MDLQNPQNPQPKSKMNAHSVLIFYFHALTKAGLFLAGFTESSKPSTQIENERS